MRREKAGRAGAGMGDVDESHGAGGCRSGIGEDVGRGQVGPEEEEEENKERRAVNRLRNRRLPMVESLILFCAPASLECPAIAFSQPRRTWGAARSAPPGQNSTAAAHLQFRHRNQDSCPSCTGTVDQVYRSDHGPRPRHRTEREATCRLVTQHPPRLPSTKKDASRQRYSLSTGPSRYA